MKHDAWVEVDLSAIKHNVAQVRSLIGPNVRLMAVVKADAYGHGIVEPSKAIIDAGADALAVTRLDEAARLRAAGVASPILVFNPIQRDFVEEAVSLGVDITVCTAQLVSALDAAAREAGSTVRAHLKIDSGMGRLGVLPQDALSLAKTIDAAKNVSLAATYTHLAAASERNISHAQDQLRQFRDAVDSISSAGIDPGVIHAANSAAIIRLPDSHFDMVRPGTVIYGQYPSRHVPHTLDLCDTWRLKARVSFIKDVPTGRPIGYGGEFITRRPSKIAVVPLGWADGLTLTPESIARRSVLRLAAARLRREPPLTIMIRGRKAPIVGRIAMQMCSVDVTDIPGAAIGDDAIIPARRVTTNPLIPRIYQPDNAL